MEKQAGGGDISIQDTVATPSAYKSVESNGERENLLQAARNHHLSAFFQSSLSTKIFSSHSIAVLASNDVNRRTSSQKGWNFSAKVLTNIDLKTMVEGLPYNAPHQPQHLTR